jgi:hypothetical protein
VLEVAAKQPDLTQAIQAWTAGLTAAVAVLALILSAWGLYLQRIDKRPRLRVRGKCAVLFAGPELSPPTYAFEVANVGHVPVTVQSVYLRPGHRWNDKIVWRQEWLLHESQRLPCRLEPGESATWYVDHYPILMFLKSKGYKKRARVALIAADGLGNFHQHWTRFYLEPTRGQWLHTVWLRLRGNM